MDEPILSLDDVIELTKRLNNELENKVDPGKRVGLYIEMKHYEWYLEAHGLDIAQALYERLAFFGLGNVSDCSDSVPIVIQGFNLRGLTKFASLSDLPLIFVISPGKSFYEEKPFKKGDWWQWQEVSELVHGIAPA